MLWVAAATATSPCTGDGCIDEASAAFIAPYDFFQRRCSELKPELREKYSAVVANFLQDADPGFLEKLRASKAYADVSAKLESKANESSPEELEKACDGFIRR